MKMRTLIGMCMLTLAMNAYGQGDFPSKPLTMIVPYTSGSASDAQARLFAEQISASLGQSVVVENRPGANAAIGMRALENAPADGYTIGMAGGSPMVINPFITKDLGYDPDAFVHVHGISRAPSAFVVGKDSPYKTLADALSSAEADNRALSIGTYAAVYELAVLALEIQSGQKTQNIPYKGAAAVVSDLIGGHLEMGFIDISSSVPLIKEGQLRVLALATAEESETFEGVPLVSATLPNFEMTPWTSFIMRKDVPVERQEKIENALREAHDSQPVRQYFERSGAIPLPLGREGMRRHHETEKVRYAEITSAGNILPK